MDPRMGVKKSYVVRKEFRDEITDKKEVDVLDKVMNEHAKKFSHFIEEDILVYK